jgi:hypothetical protein
MTTYQMNPLLCCFDPGAYESQDRDAKNCHLCCRNTHYLRKVAVAHPAHTASVRQSLCGHLVTRVTSHCDRALSLDGEVNVHSLLRFLEKFCRLSHRANVLLIPPQGLLLRNVRVVQLM